ncbi:MAG TPA: hypothetical protein VIV40_00080 [Kofleriaceae bacterium]
MTKLWALPLLFAGCVIAPSQGDDDVDQTQRDVDHYNELSAQLDMRRTEFLGRDVQELAAAGSTLYWLDTTNLDPRLMHYDGHDKLAYGFSIGDANHYNYRASASVVVTAEPGSDAAIYRAYDATVANRLLGETSIPKPVGAQWSAYAVDSTFVYIMDGTTLKRWQPGTTPTVVTTLESAGVSAGEFWDFGVAGNTMVFIESGRVWSMDLVANKATWLMNMTEAGGSVDFRPDGVLFDTATGLAFYDYAQHTLIDMRAKIDANPFKINNTFASAAHYYQDFTRYKQWLIYIGQSGVFAYDMKADKITPLLLSPNRADLRVDYRYPVALDSGEMFVTGLTSTSGATGADGPTYKLGLSTFVQ